MKNFKNIFLQNQKADDCNLVYSIGCWSTNNISNDDLGLTLTFFMTGSNLFPNASAWVKAYTALSANVFPSCSNSTYPQHSGERYKTNGPLVCCKYDFCFQIKEAKGSIDAHIHFWLGKETSQVRESAHPSSLFLLNSVSSQSACGKSSFVRKPEVHPNFF